ncbi:MAG: Tm-1-like ATP-binding domain-containing protein, partial [Desulfobacterales bacterium]
MAIAVVGMLDEREEGLQLIKDHIEKRGHRPVLIDISIGTGAIESSLKPDIDCHTLARSGGTTIEKVREMLAKERDKATAMMADGLGKILQEHHQAGQLQGII